MTFPSTVRPVRRRHVFYVSGFDPNGPARYHKLYSEGAAQQAAFDGTRLEVGPRRRIDAETMGWELRYQERPDQDPAGAQAVETSYLFPRWDGIVRAYWWQERWPQLRDLLATSWRYLHTGAMGRVLRQCRTAFVTVFAPFFLLLLLLPGAVLALWAATALVRAWRAGDSLVLVAPLAAVVAVLAFFWAYWARRHWHAQWILRCYAFVGRWGGEGVPTLEARLDGMAEAICRQAQAGEDDEILIVGHSLGATMAVSVLARALQRDPELGRHGPAIGLLTLGQFMPLLSNLPAARRFRQELAMLAQARPVCWVDFCDPMDAYSFPGVDPVAAAGVVAPRSGHPQMRSPEFARLFATPPYRTRRVDQHAVHQQYLCASGPDHPYDYFAMTAGPLTLAARFCRAV